MSLDKYFKRYVWDDQKTPYTTPVGRLSRGQADYEIFAYCLFLGLLFAAVSLVAVTGKLPQGKLMGAGVYAFTVVCAAITFSFIKFYPAAVYCAVSPAAATLYYLIYGFPEGLGGIDQALIMIFILLWARYSWRVYRIAKQYPQMPLKSPSPPASRFQRPDDNGSNSP